MTTETDRLGVPLYSSREAARLLHTNRRTLERWARGYTLALNEGTRHYAGLLPEDEPIFTFGGLVELLYVAAFRAAKVRLEDIRQTSAAYGEKWSTPYPFATKRFTTLERKLLLKGDAGWSDALTGQRAAFVEELGRQFRHDGDLVGGWYPLGTDRAVVLDPERRFGQPIDPESGVLCAALAQALAVEGDEERVADWYGVSLRAVNDAAQLRQEAFIA